MSDRISVVITTHNRRELLRSTLRCVRDQTWADKEVIVVDEASSDDTAAMVACEFPEARIVHHEAARGVSGARNAGIGAARGDWLFFLDDDDLIHPRHLEELHAASLAAPPDSIVTGPMRDFAIVDGEARFAPTFCAPSSRTDWDTLNEFLEPSSQRTVMHSTILWPARLFDTVKWDETLGFNEDIDLFGRVVLAGKHIVGRRAGMYYVRLHAGPRATTARNALRLMSPVRYWLKWSDLLLPRSDRDKYAAAMRNAMMALLNEWSGVPIARDYIPRLNLAFRAWGGSRYYMTFPPRNKLKRALLQGLLDFGGPPLLRRFLALRDRLRGVIDENADYVAGFRPAATAADLADAGFIRPYH